MTIRTPHAVTSLALSPDGQTLAVTMADKKAGAMLLHAMTGEVIKTFRFAHRSVAFADDGALWLSGKSVVRHTPGTWKADRKLDGDPKVAAIDVRGDRLAISAYKRMVSEVWDLARDEKIFSWPLPRPAAGCALGGDGLLYVMTRPLPTDWVAIDYGGDGAARPMGPDVCWVAGTPSGAFLARETKNRRPANAVVSPDGRWIAETVERRPDADPTRPMEALLQITDSAGSLHAEPEWRIATGSRFSMAFAPDGRRLYAGTFEGRFQESAEGVIHVVELP